MTLRCGPYYGKIEDAIAGTRETHTGLNANVAYGVVIKRKFYIEARYDYFSRFSGRKFDGLSLSAGVRLFDIKL